MRGYGISYDTGIWNAEASTRDSFVPDVVRRELRIIRDDLHCNAVRVSGSDADRLEIAATYAAEAGLEVWFSPFTIDLTQEETLAVFADCAERAERLRQTGVEVVFVTGAELSLFTVGFLPGDTCTDRIGLLLAPDRRLPALLAEVPTRINAFLARAVAVVRERFGGRITYAAIGFEQVDWAPFDFVSEDAYRTIEVADQYRAAIRDLVAQGKPVAITEFGCASYRGAADKGSRGGMIVEYDASKRPIRLNGDYVRDETEQVAYLAELLDIFNAEGVDTAFAYTFASYHLPHRNDPGEDLDMGGYGVVKVLEDRLGSAYPDLAWEPKAAFAMLADSYRR